MFCAPRGLRALPPIVFVPRDHSAFFMRPLGTARAALLHDLHRRSRVGFVHANETPALQRATGENPLDPEHGPPLVPRPSVPGDVAVIRLRR